MLGSNSRCLIDKFSRYTDLVDEDRELLLNFYQSEIPLEAGQKLRSRGSHSELVYMVSSGWLYTSRTLTDGAVQLVDVKLPGDLIGLRDISFAECQSECFALTDARVCRFEKQRLLDIFKHSEKLTAVLFYILTRELHYLVERLTEVGRRDAFAGLANFLLVVASRLKGIGVPIENEEFEFPLTQRHLADALGLTPVHISRIVRRMREENLADINRGKARIIDSEGLMKVADLDRGYFDGDRVWLGVEDHGAPQEILK